MTAKLILNNVPVNQSNWLQPVNNADAISRLNRIKGVVDRALKYIESFPEAEDLSEKASLVSSKKTEAQLLFQFVMSNPDKDGTEHPSALAVNLEISKLTGKVAALDASEAKPTEELVDDLNAGLEQLEKAEKRLEQLEDLETNPPEIERITKQEVPRSLGPVPAEITEERPSLEERKSARDYKPAGFFARLFNGLISFFRSIFSSSVAAG